jgi:hypothetical protein
MRGDCDVGQISTGSIAIRKLHACFGVLPPIYMHARLWGRNSGVTRRT